MVNTVYNNEFIGLLGFIYCDYFTLRLADCYHVYWNWDDRNIIIIEFLVYEPFSVMGLGGTSSRAWPLLLEHPCLHPFFSFSALRGRPFFLTWSISSSGSSCLVLRQPSQPLCPHGQQCSIRPLCPSQCGLHIWTLGLSKAMLQALLSLLIQVSGMLKVCVVFLWSSLCASRGGTANEPASPVNHLVFIPLRMWAYWCDSNESQILGWFSSVKVDSVSYQVFGNTTPSATGSVPAKQNNIEFSATRTSFLVMAGPVDVNLMFLSLIEASLNAVQLATTNIWL